MAGGAVVLQQCIAELLLMRIFVAVLAGGCRGGELAHFGCLIGDVALDAGDGLMRSLQRIGFAVLTGAEIGWNKAILPMAFQTRGMLFDKLAAMRIFVATPALVGTARVAGICRIGITLDIRKIRLMAFFAVAVGMWWRQRKAKGGVQLRIDSATTHRPVFIVPEVASYAILLRGDIEAVRVFVAIGTGFPLHGAEDP